LVCFSPSTLFAVNAGIELEKIRKIYSFEVKTYGISADESIVLYGAKERKFLTDKIYGGEAGYGAISGKRSGYLEGGLILGYQSNIFSNVLVDARLFAGAGGGGSAPQGGGLIMNPTLGLGMPLLSGGTFFIEVGYMHFLNGDISSPSVACSWSWNSWRLN
jgi:hypothetical protein